MDREEVVAILGEMANLLELTGANRFKVIAHQKAARALEQAGEAIKTLIAENRLTTIDGVGKGIAEKITLLHQTGHLPELDELRKSVPPGVVAMLAIRGLGVKKVKTLWEELGVTSLGELEYACNENRLVTLTGFGLKSQEKILAGIELLHKNAGRRLLSEAYLEATRIVDALKKRGAIQVAIVGDLARSLETIESISIVAATEGEAGELIDAFIKESGGHLIDQTESGARAVTAIGLPGELHIASQDTFATQSLGRTGSAKHIEELEERAQKQNLSIEGATQEEIYQKLGLTYIHPELREGDGEIERAAQGSLPKLVELGDIAGIFHCHTTWSDGKESLETMVAECQGRGYGYLGLSDHSVSAHYAGGLTADDLLRQGEEVDRLNGKLKNFKVFKGVESDILTDGSLDYPESILASLDFVIVSVHSGFGKDKDEMTRRVIKAIEHRHTTMLGHMTGRLLLTRDGYPLDVHKVIDACAANNVVVELNANPHRLDIDWRYIGYALEKGVKIAINPDAHRIAGLDHIGYGVAIARKGGCGPDHIYNTMTTEEVMADLAGRK